MEALHCLNPGDTLLVGPGDYDEYLSDYINYGGHAVRPPSGSSWSAPTIIRSESLHQARLYRSSDPGANSSVVVIGDNPVSFVSIEGFVVDGSISTGAIGKGILIGSTGILRFKDVFIKHFASQGVGGEANAQTLFLNVDILNIGTDPTTGANICPACGEFPCVNKVCHGYYLGGSSGSNPPGPTINGGTIDTAMGAAHQMYQPGATIKNQTIKNMQAGGTWLLGNDTIVYNNVYMNSGGAVWVWRSNNSQVIGNTSYNTGPTNVAGVPTAAQDAAFWDCSGNTVMKNNLVVAHTEKHFAVNLTVGDNQCVGPDQTPNPSLYQGNVCAKSGQVGCLETSAGATYFVSPPTNMRLATLSPALGQGVTLVAPYNVDKDGNPRVAPFDTGAYQGAGGVVPLSPDYLSFGDGVSDTVVGVHMTPAVTVEVRAANNVVVPEGTYSVTVSLHQNPAGGTLNCGPATCTKNTIAGVVTFDTLSVNTVGTSYTLGAVTTGLRDSDSESDFFAVTPTTPPSAPTALTTLSDTVVSNGQLQLGWSYVQGAVAATGFVVERQEGCVGAFTARPGMPVALTPLTYTDTALVVANTYCWQVKARSAGGVLSAPSNSVQRTGTVVPAPTNLTISTFTTGQFLR